MIISDTRGKSGYKSIVIVCCALIWCAAALLCLIGGGMNTSLIARAEAPEIKLIAKFSTYYGDSSANRKSNVGLAARKIDGTVLGVEDEFSFNDTVGKRTEANGFKVAYIISGGAFVEGVGGGVCQVSSTLYNCALLANLAITKVYAHSLPVSYVAPSFDAMVSSVSDLRFVNTLSAPIQIKMSADGKYLKAEIYGIADCLLRRRSETIESVPFETEIKEDATLPLGEERVDSYGKNGLKSEGWLDYFENGKIVKSVLVRKDFYKPQKQLVLKGIAEEKIEQPS